MVGAAGLDVRVMIVEAKIDEPRFGLIIPLALAIPKLGRAGLEGDAIQSDPKPGAIGPLRLRCGLGIEREMKVVVLRGYRVRVSAPGELAWGVVGQTISSDHALAARNSDRDPICADLRRDALAGRGAGVLGICGDDYSAQPKEEE